MTPDQRHVSCQNAGFGLSTFLFDCVVKFVVTVMVDGKEKASSVPKNKT